MPNTSVGVEQLVEKLESWAMTGWKLLPNLVAALLVFIVFAIFARVAGSLIRKPLSRFSDNQQVTGLLQKLLRSAILIGGFFVALSILQLDGTVKSLLAGVGILGLALGFAFQDIASNFVAGVLLAVRRPFRVGDLIETGDFMGKVEDINLRNTICRSFQGQRVIIPNKEVFGNRIINYSSNGERRLDLSVGVAYGDDLEKVEEVARQALEGIEERDRSREVEILFEEFGASSINFSGRVWIKVPEHNFLVTRHQAVKAIKRAFDENGITIPFPIRTLDFGIVGGVPLNEALPAFGRNGSAGRGSGATSEPRDGARSSQGRA